MEKSKEVYYPPKEFTEKAYVKSIEQYNKLYLESINNPDEFWAKKAEDIKWFKKWDSVFEWEDKENIRYSWFKNGKLNACYNCLDRYIPTKGDQVALIWQAENESESKKYTYKQLLLEVSRFSNVLKKKGIKKGDRVAIYLPMIPELVISVLACARIGAIHTVIFAGYSISTIRDRINFSESKMLITADGAYRAGKKIDYKSKIDKALEGTKTIESIIYVNRINQDITLKPGFESWWNQEINSQDILDTCPAEEMDSEDPLFILFNSGTVGAPKGTVHTTGGYLVYVNQTFKYIFDYHDGDIHWCTADIGWITGHSYLIYGPLSNGATVLMFEGVPTYPDPEVYWRIIDKYKVNIFYTAPTVIRSLMRFGEEPVLKHDLSSLKLLGSVGEPINPEVWRWYHKYVGKDKCPIVDTWWQTESGGFLLAPFPGAFPLKPGSATKPFFGVIPKILRNDGSEADVNEKGNIVIEKPWPGMMRTIYKNHQKYLDIYWSKFKGVYFCGDGAKVDEDGDYTIFGRVDNVIKVSGHRLGAPELESAIVSDKNVAEAAVVPYPHKIKGSGIYAFVILKVGIEPSDSLVQEIREHVSIVFGPIAKPDKIQFVNGLPKTSSGKIIRRVLKEIAKGTEDYGDLSTLPNPEIINILKKGKV